jgi:hypothetical protein
VVNQPVWAPGMYQMRVALRDQSSERVGAANEFIDVPDLTRGRLTLSSVLLRQSVAGAVPDVDHESPGHLPASGRHRERGCTPETAVTIALPIAATGSRRKAGSTEIGTAASIGGETIDVRKIRLLEVRMLIEDLVFGHSGTQPGEHVPDSDPEASDAGLSPALPRLDRNPAYYSNFHFGNSNRQYAIFSGETPVNAGSESNSSAAVRRGSQER